ncbi:hypothetical protein IJT93_02795 [bacterium]|nr:hypothetical protein [bacterium]
MSESTGNNQYRDRLFKFIFGNPENKEWTLSLYNAVNGSHYTDADAIRLNTIETAVYMGMRNDVSFLIDDTISFYEQQSTFNPNMPMRLFIYAGMVYARYIEEGNDYRRYSQVQQKAPAPKCVCFYNGTAEKEDKIVLKLSDSFAGESDIEVKVTMININYGHSQELLEVCKPLKEYAWFVDRVRYNKTITETLEAALDEALKELPGDSLIRPYLLANKAEVKRMCITEYDHVRTLAEQREEGREEGRTEGIEVGKLRMLVKLVEKGLLTLEQAAEEVGMTISGFKEKAGSLNLS